MSDTTELMMDGSNNPDDYIELTVQQLESIQIATVGISLEQFASIYQTARHRERSATFKYKVRPVTWLLVPEDS